MFEHIAVRRKPGFVINGIMSAGSRHFDCALGRGGTTVFKREGDGATPAHRVLRPVFGYWREDRLPARPPSGLCLDKITPWDGWCDDSSHPAYNGPVRLPFAGSHEKLMRDDCLYDLCIVLDWNMAPCRSRERGSAIFLHAAKPGLSPTLGCIALALPDLMHLVAGMTRQTRVTVLRQS